MRPDDLIDAIGDVEETFVKKAKENQRIRKPVWFLIVPVAACLALTFYLMLGDLVQIDRGLCSGAGPASVEPDGADSGGESGAEYKEVWIYYVENGEMAGERQYLPAQVSEIFNAWRQQNKIGDEVELLDCQMESYSETGAPQSSEEGIDSHENEDYCVLYVTVSKNLETYYHNGNEELLLESLKKTMTEYSGLEWDEYHLLLK